MASTSEKEITPKVGRHCVQNGISLDSAYVTSLPGCTPTYDSDEGLQQTSTQPATTQQPPTQKPPTQPASTQQPPTQQPPTQPASTQQTPTQPVSTQQPPTQKPPTQPASTQQPSTQQPRIQQPSTQRTTQPLGEAAETGLPSFPGIEELEKATKEILDPILKEKGVINECCEIMTRICRRLLACEIKQREYVENITRQKTPWVQIDMREEHSIVPSSLVLLFYLQKIRQFGKRPTVDESAEVTKRAQELSQRLESPMSQTYEKALATWTSSGGHTVKSAQKLESCVLKLLEAKRCFVKPRGDLPDQWLGLKNGGKSSVFQTALFEAFNVTKRLHFALLHGITDIQIGEVTGALQQVKQLGESPGYSKFLDEKIRQWHAMIENSSPTLEMVTVTLSSLMEGIIDQILIEAPCLKLTKLANEAIRVKLLGDQLDLEPFKVIAEYRNTTLHTLAIDKPKQISEGMTFDEYAEIVKDVISKILQACQNQQTGNTVLEALRDYADRCIDTTTRQENSWSEGKICLTQADTGNKHAETELVQSKSTQDLVGIVRDNLPLDENTVTCVTQLTKLVEQQTSVHHISVETHKAQVRLSEKLLKKGKKKDSVNRFSGTDGDGSSGGGENSLGNSRVVRVAQRRGSSQMTSNDKEGASKQRRSGLNESAGILSQAPSTSVTKFQEEQNKQVAADHKSLQTPADEDIEALRQKAQVLEKPFKSPSLNFQDAATDTGYAEVDIRHSERLKLDQARVDMQAVHPRVYALKQQLKELLGGVSAMKSKNRPIFAEVNHKVTAMKIGRKQCLAELYNMTDFTETRKVLETLKTIVVGFLSLMGNSKPTVQKTSFYVTEQQVDNILSPRTYSYQLVLPEHSRQVMNSIERKMANQTVEQGLIIEKNIATNAKDIYTRMTLCLNHN